ncbi:GIY-YIG nuclease family protein [Cupriavidus sp. 30B13]|uniref:GIY-YIG nuclease family protein n=1 Tax=Cupriavidus sp. 30B13 TaxID=3384241 RepID=UPI003B8FAB60
MPADGTVSWFLYLLECEGNSIYTGITTDVERRFAQHQAGTGAKYTRSHKPIRILGWKEFENRSEASKAEAAAKRLNSAQKRDLCATLSIIQDPARPPPAG